MSLKKKIVIILCFEILLGTSVSFPDQNEMIITLDILKELEIFDCVFVSDTPDIFKTNEILSNFIKISFQNIITNFWDSGQFAKFTKRKERVYHNKAFILNKMDHIQDFLIIDSLPEYTWLVYDHNITISVPYNCEFITIRQITGSTYKLTEFYTYKNKTFANDFGTWEESFGLRIRSVSAYWRKLNLNGSVIVTIHPDLDDPALCEKVDNRSTPCHIYEMINGFAEMMNFQNKEIVVPMNKVLDAIDQYGDILTQWLTFIHNYYIPKRIGPIFYNEVSLFIKYPHRVLRSDFYLLPFDKNLWLVIISSLLVGTFCVLILKIQIKNDKYCLTEDIFSVCGIFCNQCNEERIENNSLKIVLLMMNILGYIIVNSFGAVITAFLSVKSPIIPFNNLEELGKDGSYTIQMTEKGILHVFLAQSKNPLHENILKNHSIWVNDPFEVGNIKECADNFTDCYHDDGDVYDANAAFEYSKSLIDKLCRDKKLVKYGEDVELVSSCELLKIPEPVVKIPQVLVLNENSPFMDSFNINWLRFNEYGIWKRMEKHVVLGFEKNAKKKEDIFESVEFEQMIQVLSLPLIGTLLAGLIIIGESVYNRKCKRLWLIFKRDKMQPIRFSENERSIMWKKF